jgi:membrane-associated protease RseP (regulator of RpoE activity)
LTAAKHFGVKCTEYMIGFGPRLFSFKRGETEYGVKGIPLGGYVRILGMYPPAKEGEKPRKEGRLSHLVDQARSESLVGLEPGEEDRVCYKLPVHKRVVIMMAGPFVNLVLAIVLFTIVLVGFGLPQPNTTVDAVLPCVPTVANPEGKASDGGGCAGGEAPAAAAADLDVGATITAVAGQPVESWDQVTAALQGAEGPTQVTVESDGLSKTITAMPVAYPELTEDGELTGETIPRVFLGIRPGRDYVALSIVEVPGYMWDITTLSVQALFSLPVRLYELGGTLATNGERDPEGPVSVVGVGRLGGEIAAETAEPAGARVASILALAASLNLFLFLFNLLPVLPLDGGHVAAALWEAIRRRVANWRGKPDPGVVDTARLLPLTYAVAVVLIGVGVMVIWADLFKPITLN